MDAIERWRRELAAWALPDDILRSAPEPPFAFPVAVFEHAADQPPRDTPSRRRALEALVAGGSVLDVGCGAGAASLALVPPAGQLIGVDPSPQMLEAFRRRARAAGVAHRTVEGRWPQVAGAVEVADVVVCHHVLYDVADLGPFVVALDRHARRRVVLELTDRHPLAWMNPLWERFHGLARPEGPTADDAAAAVAELGIGVRVERFEAPPRTDGLDPAARVALVRRRLCLPPERDPEVAAALAALPQPPTRSLVTLWWDA